MDLVSIIMPVHNASSYLDESLESVCNQTYRPIEIILFDDCSTDNSWEILNNWVSKLLDHNITPIVCKSNFECAKGPGYSRNQCVKLSQGKYLCHLDADDIMSSERVEIEYNQAILEGDSCLIGCNFSRIPPEATPYYTNWLNNMTNNDLMLQQYRECTVICPSWFMHRNVYNRVAELRGGIGYVETSDNLSRIPEDLFFFLDHLQLGGTLSKCNLPLVQYRYSANSWSIGTKSIDLQKVRISYLQQRVLDHWDNFSIWGYGRDGRRFLNLLSEKNARKVVSFCDVDFNKIGRSYFSSIIREYIPIIHFRDVKPPFIVCVGSKKAGGFLEKNIEECNFIEGIDYFHFC